MNVPCKFEYLKKKKLTSCCEMRCIKRNTITIRSVISLLHFSSKFCVTTLVGFVGSLISNSSDPYLFWGEIRTFILKLIKVR